MPEKTKAINEESAVRNKITLITFFCSIMILFIHSYNLATYGITEASTGFSHIIYCLERTWNFFGYTTLSTFFFISGFLFFRTYELRKTKEKYISRITSILIPYIIWCTVYYLYFVLLTNLPYIRDIINTEKTPFSLISFLNALWVEEYYTLWFLQELIIYIALCPLIYLLMKNKYIGGIILIVLLFFPEYTILGFSLSGYLYYMAGAYLAINFQNLIYYRSRVMTTISCLFVIIMLATQCHYVLYPLSRLGIIISFWFIADLLPLDREYPWWMKITFFTYVAHDIFLEMFEKIILMVFGRNPIYALLDYLLIPFFVFGVLVAIAGLLRKCAPKIWGVITGMRI